MNILEDFDFKLLENFKDSPEKKYKEYLETHISNVQKAYEELKNRLPDLFDDLEIPVEELDEQVKKHDANKWLPEEFDGYAYQFYGNNGGRFKTDTHKFQLAWEHHYSSCPHHPEYWGCHVDMPLSCIIEMIADWWSFSFKSGNLEEIFDFWEKDKKSKSQYMTQNTLEKVEEILRALKDTFKKQSNITVETLEEAFSNILTEETIFKIEKIIEKKKFKEVENLIKSANSIAIARHISPDDDAIFSAKAMYKAIKTKYPNKKEVELLNDRSLVRFDKEDVVIYLDLAVQKRVCGMIVGNPKIIRIDHHPGGDVKADAEIVSDAAGSTCELVTLFLNDQKYDIDTEIAESLFKGIISDTGRMQYSINQTTLAAISILKDAGVDYKKVYNQMYVKDEVSLKGKSYILSNYKQTPNGVAYLYLDKNRAKTAGIDMEKTGLQVYEMGEIKGCPIWVSLIDRGNSIGMRIRSRTIPINGIIEKFGGGGHENASGLKVKNKEEAKKVLTALDEYLAKEKKKNPNLK